MTRAAHTLGSLLLAGAMASLLTLSCRSSPTGSKAFARCASTQADQEPMVALWQLGPPLPHRTGDSQEPPRVDDQLVFAAWSDCVVVFREGDSLKNGHVQAERMNDLLGTIREAGFFKPPLDDGLLFPDGPVQTLVVRDPPNQRKLSHYGPSDEWLRDQIAKTGPHALPSREQMSAFVAMWDKIVGAIGAVRPADASPYQHDRSLRRPN